MEWTVTISNRAKKNLQTLPDKVKKTLAYLIRDIELTGPVKGNWPNYSKLGKEKHHCHLKKGKPTYVAVWEVKDREIRLVEVVYAGTHEKAPY
jgi:mRNA-degrading endonuclease RelE of RelBE toxin-antitoxin system